MCIHKHNHTHSYLNRHFFLFHKNTTVIHHFFNDLPAKMQRRMNPHLLTEKVWQHFHPAKQKKLNLIKLLSQDYFSVSFQSSRTDRKRILTNKWSVHLCNKDLLLPMSLHPSNHSKKSHHVIYLPHVDAL